MQDDEGEVYRGPRTDDNASNVVFDARIICHIIYGNDYSASVPGHIRHGYATASTDQAKWFKSKDAFLALIHMTFERMWDELYAGKGRDHGKDNATD